MSKYDTVTIRSLHASRSCPPVLGPVPFTCAPHIRASLEHRSTTMGHTRGQPLAVKLKCHNIGDLQQSFVC